MYVKARTLDDLMRSVFNRLLKSGTHVSSSKGRNREVIGAILELADPRARLSRTEKKGTLFSCLGELFWYLSGTNSLAFIQRYIATYDRFSDDGRTVFGAYGPRIFGPKPGDQFASIRGLLQRKPSSRQAVIQIFDRKDLTKEHKDVPCTCTIQMFIRNRRLHMFTSMRSNDAYLGLPHDVFSFTMLQEIMARTLGAGLGVYRHAVGSLHLYEDNRDDARRFLNEGWQDRIAMPPMPEGDPWPSLRKVQNAEQALRSGRSISIATLKLGAYWSDIVRLFQVFFAKSEESVIRIKKKMRSKAYQPYIDQRIEKKRHSAAAQNGQLLLPGTEA